jgi:hypothetical protein
MLASRTVRWNGFVVGARGYKTNQCVSAVAIDNRTGSSTYFITADW